MSTIPPNPNAHKPASKIGALRDLLFALLQEHERDSAIPIIESGQGRIMAHTCPQAAGEKCMTEDEGGTRRPAMGSITVVPRSATQKILANCADGEWRSMAA